MFCCKGSFRSYWARDVLEQLRQASSRTLLRVHEECTVVERRDHREARSRYLPHDELIPTAHGRSYLVQQGYLVCVALFTQPNRIALRCPLPLAFILLPNSGVLTTGQRTRRKSQLRTGQDGKASCIRRVSPASVRHEQLKIDDCSRLMPVVNPITYLSCMHAWPPEARPQP